ncbi:hypothetical protein C8R43DRAFT_702944 [Mycena crocata]|nr:hypothetical protein C8R43DRAFT_702944 [Mycena crocata]
MTVLTRLPHKTRLWASKRDFQPMLGDLGPVVETGFLGRSPLSCSIPFRLLLRRSYPLRFSFLPCNLTFPLFDSVTLSFDIFFFLAVPKWNSHYSSFLQLVVPAIRGKGQGQERTRLALESWAVGDFGLISDQKMSDHQCSNYDPGRDLDKQGNICDHASELGNG